MVVAVRGTVPLNFQSQFDVIFLFWAGLDGNFWREGGGRRTQNISIPELES
jgi:hypothetical protein